ncbi:MAG: hypothetical protein HRU20_31485 [Pseudomonadales bacterium]|nr:hypothetical protein [Pseudomonadales bacterium]
MDEECHCKLSDLFEIPKAIVEIDEQEWNIARQIKEKLKIGYHYLGLGSYIESKKVRELNPENKKSWNKFLKAPETYIRTCYDYYYNSEPMNTFVPKAHIQDKINQYTNKHSIGVHFRGTDNSKALAKSPVEAFIQLMEKEIEADDECSFLLATDEPAIEKLLKETFTGRIITHTKRSLDRNNPIAIEDAVVDLYSLGNCKKIIGSHISSFSEYAAAIQGIELQKASLDLR